MLLNLPVTYYSKNSFEFIGHMFISYSFLIINVYNVLYKLTYTHVVKENFGLKFVGTGVGSAGEVLVPQV